MWRENFFDCRWEPFGDAMRCVVSICGCAETWSGDEGGDFLRCWVCLLRTAFVATGMCLTDMSEAVATYARYFVLGTYKLPRRTYLGLADWLACTTHTHRPILLSVQSTHSVPALLVLFASPISTRIHTAKSHSVRSTAASLHSLVFIPACLLHVLHHNCGDFTQTPGRLKVRSIKHDVKGSQ